MKILFLFVVEFVNKGFIQEFVLEINLNRLVSKIFIEYANLIHRNLKCHVSYYLLHKRMYLAILFILTAV